MKKILIGLLITVVIGGALYLYRLSSNHNSTDTKQQTSQQLESSTQTKDKMTPISLTEIATHATKSDCWLAIEGKVYDVTPFIAANKHPGGPAILMGCGKDATSLFTNRPKDNRPHSERAENMLPQYQIGVLSQ